MIALFISAIAIIQNHATYPFIIENKWVPIKEGTGLDIC